MKFELKAVKYAAFNSHETHCFEAKLYKDGKPFCFVSNEGYGGSNDFYPLNNGKPNELWDEIKKINKELSKEIIDSGISHGDSGTYQLNNSLDLVVGNLMNKYLQEKEIKKVLKRISYVKPDTPYGECYQLPAKFKPTAANIEALRTAPWWKDDFVVLNELSITECKNYI